MNMHHLILYLLLISTFALCSFWHYRENRMLSRQWRKDLDDFSAQWLTRFAWMRTLQTLAILFVCLFIIAFYHWQLFSTRHELMQSIEAQMTAEAKAAQIDGASREAAAQAEARETAMRDELMRLASMLQKPAGSAPAAAAPVAVTPTSPAAPVVLQQPAPTAAQSLEALYNPEDSTPGASAEMDRIKKRFEDMLVNYMFLRKCGQTAETDYHIITSALSQEMASINAPGRLQYDILTAAQGSFKEVYANSDCNAPETPALLAQYREYIATISRQYSVPAN